MALTSFSIITPDLPGTRAFFAGVLALPVSGDDDFLTVDGGTITFTAMRGAMVPMGLPGGVILQFEVDDVGAATDEARQRGGIVLSGPARTDWGTESAYLQGPDGLVVELFRNV
jgi:catechol 2,3-dioxygenase-like lactoylglutathione lyase family enzyme